MYERKDYFYEKARKSGLRARSSYKLIEIQNKYKIIKKNDSVLDIGCAPGSWLQIIKKFTKGNILGVDLVNVKPLKGVDFIQMDVTDSEFVPLIKEKYGLFNVIVSDIAPKTSGVRARDQALSYELSRMSFIVAAKLLKKGGNFVVKTFQSQDTDDLFKEIKKSFTFVKRYIPESTRRSSKELYIIATGFKL
ncbi:RlmE family RNA methyltransferase [Candidatus Woesearchaeota archaeon]|nr:RlmE family RNA methyltransferase [Candidatus Woesearchaeota archaeon]